MRHPLFSSDDEPVRRQRGGSGRGRGYRGHEGWAGPWGAALGGPPPWVAQMFGPDLTGMHRRGGGPGGGRGRPRARRGDVRSAILDVLATSPEGMNGYQVIQQIAERSHHQWKPSPGSVYPTISQLEDEGLVEDAPSGRKALQLTAEGRAYVVDHPEELAAVWAPFVPEEDDHEAVNFKQVIGQTVGAIVQVVSTGTPDQREKALHILAETRRQMYGLLAEGPDDLDEDLEGDLDAPDELDELDELDETHDGTDPRER
ncbi:PadR family transcriptional regulator [Nocardioides aurantiacus]|uniref:PadR family transcriptional regulator n=1 Tax=Nocardioides aurantiacus TaxID=86796 RepID=A0A3N2CS95_9ACTN|nr:PadR family transcriptional regulator [Nocardioides aurantiacus]ROR90296.1 PadR family transcriptional regulator [Nocardioides aurantiacus]